MRWTYLPKFSFQKFNKSLPDPLRIIRKNAGYTSTGDWKDISWLRWINNLCEKSLIECWDNRRYPNWLLWSLWRIVKEHAMPVCWATHTNRHCFWKDHWAHGCWNQTVSPLWRASESWVSSGFMFMLLTRSRSGLLSYLKLFANDDKQRH